MKLLDTLIALRSDCSSERLVSSIDEVIEHITSRYKDDEYNEYEYELDGEYAPPEKKELEPEQKTFYSERLLHRVLRGESIENIFRVCSVYVYGYAAGDVKEIALASKLKAIGFVNTDGKCDMDIAITGTAYRVEMVADDDVWSYASIPIGRGFRTPTRFLCANDTYHIAECKFLPEM